LLYYRYRTEGELSLKELRYGEIYFSSVEENNDPFDCKTFLVYDFSEDKWRRLFECAWKDIRLPDETISAIATKLSKIVANEHLRAYEDVMNFDFRIALTNCLPNNFLPIATTLSYLIKNFIELYKPTSAYIASFSRKQNNFLMWSHYASKHRGYCLIFKDNDGYLYQDHSRITSCINGMGIGDKFSFDNIQYVSSCTPLDASRFMGRGLSDVKFKDEDERLAFMTENYAPFYEKQICWEYEEETRLTLFKPENWICGINPGFSPDDRLLYYEPTQLVGIILGALMKEETKDRIRNIVRKNSRKLAETSREGAMLDFVLFEARLSSCERDVCIEPKEIYCCGSSITHNDKHFAQRFNSWQQRYDYK